MSRDAQSERKKLLLLCIPITMGLGYIYYGWTSLQDARTSVNWPVTPGTIVNSRVETHTTDGETYDSTTVEYVYTVDGVEYSSDVVRFGAPRPGAGGLSQYFSRRPDLPRPGSRESPMYPVGKAVSVSYEPSNVTNAVLEPGGESYDFLYIGGALALVPLLAGLGLNTLYRVQHAETTPNRLDKVVTLFYTGVAMLVAVPFTLSYRFAYLLTALGVILPLVGNFLDDELGFPLIIISLCCCLVPGVGGMLFRFASWVNIELPEKMNDPDPAVRRRAEMMQGRIMIMIVVFMVGAFLFVFGREIWLHGWSR